VFLPVFLIYLASFITPLYHVRYAFTYSTPFYVLVGAGLASLWERWRLLAGLSLGVLVLFSGISLYNYHTDPRYASDDHRAAVEYLSAQWRPGDAILVNAGYAYTALLTYWDDASTAPWASIIWRGRLVDYPGRGAIEGSSTDEGTVVLQTGTIDGDPSLGWGEADSDFYAMSRAETEAALERLFADFERVWVYRIYDTVADPDGFVRGWLAEHGTQFEDQVFTGEAQLRVQGFLTGRDPQAGAGQPIDETLVDGSLRLVAATHLPPAVAAGGALDLALVWEVASPLDSMPPGEDPLLFAGLFDDSGRRWAQADERPLGTLYPVSAWPEGALVRVPLQVPLLPGTPPGRYRLEVGWYTFVDGQPVWLPWTSGERLVLGEVEVLAPRDWSVLPVPEVTYPAGVEVGDGVQFLGFDALLLQAYPGEVVHLDLYWQALHDMPEPGLVVLQLVDDSRHVLAEATGAPVGGRALFAGLEAGQVVRDPRSFTLPGDLAPGVYNLWLGRRGSGGGWLPVRRGPFPLGETCPLVTVRALGRPLDLTSPQVQEPVNAEFGAPGSDATIRLVGYDLQPPASNLQSRTPGLQLTLYWQALAPMVRNYKVFVHLVGEGGPSDIRAQADVYPYLPTMAWVPGEYLRDQVVVDLPGELAPGRYVLLMGVYDEATGERLLATAESGHPLGDDVLLQEFRLEE